MESREEGFLDSGVGATLGKSEGLLSREAAEAGRAAEFSPSDLQFAEKVSGEADEELEAEKNKFIDAMKKQKLGSEELLELLDKGEIFAEFVEIVDRYEPLSELVQSGVIKGEEYFAALDSIRKKEPFKRELERLVIGAREIRELAMENAIRPADRSNLIKEYAGELAGQPGRVKNLLKKFENYIMAQAENAYQNGVLQANDLEQMKTYYTQENVTIMGTARDDTMNDEMAGAILGPALDKIDKWRKIGELKHFGLISDDQAMVAGQVIAVGEVMPEKISRLMVGLERLHYARFRGVLTKDEDYQKAMRLLPIISVSNQRHALELDSLSEAKALAEFPEFLPINENPLDEHKRMLQVLIEAWEAMLGWELMGEFGSVLNGNKIQNYESTHQFLVGLNNEYAKDTRAEEEKKMDYLTKMRQFLAGLPE